MKHTFNVIIYDINKKTVVPYDVIPYFVYSWNKDSLKSKVSNKEMFKTWVEKTSKYNYWARCEYEILIAPWPYIEEKDKMVKIDVHHQLIHNLDILVDILIDELELKI